MPLCISDQSSQDDSQDVTSERLRVGCECKFKMKWVRERYSYHHLSDAQCTWPPSNINLPEKAWPVHDHQAPVNVVSNAWCWKWYDIEVIIFFFFMVVWRSSHILPQWTAGTNKWFMDPTKSSSFDYHLWGWKWVDATLLNKYAMRWE